MPHADELDTFLKCLLCDFDLHVYKHGCYGGNTDYPIPSLTNEVLPMFTDRWAPSGPNQHTQEIFRDMRPALQLASRLLTEDWPLLWFSQLTFVERNHRTLPARTYLTPTKYICSPAAIAKVKENLKELGEVITLIHAPRSCKKNAYGITYASRSAMSFSREFRHQDWPQFEDRYESSRYYHFRPCIVMNAYFQDYFRSATSSVTECYRVSFVFAITLVHEVAHAYNFWLNGMTREPLWNQWEKNAELGFSWERNVIGRVIHPLHDAKSIGFRFLFNTQLGEYKRPKDRDRVLVNFMGDQKREFTKTDIDGVKCKWPLLDPSGFRGSELFLDTACDRYIAAVYAIPMAWVVDWFSEEEWVRRKKDWVKQNLYKPPRLSNAFVILYERNPNKAQVMRPLVPDVETDAIILQEKARQDAKKPSSAVSGQVLRR